MLVNTIGAFQPGDALSTTPETLRLMFGVNLGPALWLSQAVGYVPDLERVQVVSDGLLAVAAVGGDGSRYLAGALDDPADGGSHLRAVGGIALLDGVVDDVVVGDLGL